MAATKTRRRKSADPDKPKHPDRAFADGVIDEVCKVMHQRYRSTPIDRLLCKPYDAIDMAKAVCANLKIEPHRDNINRVCAIALNARKRGDLRRDRY